MVWGPTSWEDDTKFQRLGIVSSEKKHIQIRTLSSLWKLKSLTGI